MRQNFFGKNCANAKSHSFATYAIRIFNEGNNHSFPVATLSSTSTLQILISPCHKCWMPDLEKN